MLTEANSTAATWAAGQPMKSKRVPGSSCKRTRFCLSRQTIQG